MKTSTHPAAAAGGAGSGAGGAGAGAHHPHSNPHTHAQSLPRPWSTREIANRIAKDEAVAILFGAETNERIAARAAIEDLQVQCELNEQSNKDKYQLLPRTKKEALHEAPELLALVDIVEGVIRKLHFSCLYLVDKCLVKTVKPVVHTYCHEYSNYLDQNCAELRKSIELSMSSLVLVFHGIQHMIKQKDDLNEKAQSLAKTLEALNRSIALTDSSGDKAQDLDNMAIIPEHIRKEVQLL
jgi:hypothetical protein